jgi:hypothetical protein
MNPFDVVIAWNKASMANPPASLMEASQKYLSDDFQNIDKDGKVLMDKQAYSAMGPLLYSAFPDLNYVWGDHRQEGNDLVATFNWEGTFTNDLDLSAMGMGVIKASGKKIVWPEFKARFTVRDNQITSIQEIFGGLEPFLAPLGVKMPAA